MLKAEARSYGLTFALCSGHCICPPQAQPLSLNLSRARLLPPTDYSAWNAPLLTVMDSQYLIGIVFILLFLVIIQISIIHINYPSAVLSRWTATYSHNWLHWWRCQSVCNKLEITLSNLIGSTQRKIVSLSQCCLQLKSSSSFFFLTSPNQSILKINR